ncbi:non-muscle caldesmon-like isoform X2 [Astyanax mexicanus]|uniref:Non-muscle caldesmon-like isoform X2 n=1 Tax=Astyanax mexicanus TaxID=7994 RepID=A0A8T2M9P5_ASTMX|nr:non-muscle caldesmon-like isoform X2 [Astyanax mexicanus]
MSSAILRRNSSKQGLQNLLRVTAQRSIEDAEEIERERRRRARESLRKERSLTGSSGSPQDGSGPTEECLYHSGLKPSSPGGLEEDEGFSDWTQRLERDRRARQEENGPREEDLEVERTMNGATKREDKISSSVLTQPLKAQYQVEEEEEYQPVKKSSVKRMQFGERQSSFKDKEAEEWKEEVTRINKRQEEDPRPHAEEKVKRQEVKVSYTSKVFLQHDRMPSANNEDTAGEEVTSQLFKTKKTVRNTGQTSEPREPAEGNLETEQKLEKIRRSHQEKESQELEHLRLRQAEAEVELEELKRKREERRRVREEEERRREEEEHLRLVKEEDEKRQMKEDIERRRMEAAEKRMKNLSTSSPDKDDSFNPLSPKSHTNKREHEERLTAENTCLVSWESKGQQARQQHNNSFKKTQPPVLLSKIDDRLEQYTHAVEISAKEPKTVKAAAVDMPSVPEPVTAKKNLFEAGEAWNQTTFKGTPSKDTEGLKVAVAERITQWVKGSPESGNKNMPSKPSDVKAGDVLQKKNMWEIIGEGSAGGRSGAAGKNTSAGKRYKFVVTGHGKYEKISIDDDQYDGYTNGKSSDLCQSDL